MKVRADIAELLRAGCSNREIAARLHVDAGTAAAARRTLGLPKHRSGVRPASSPQDLFRQRVRPVAGGHLEWIGYHTNSGTPALRWAGRQLTAGRVAFVMRHNREPVGQVRAGCDYEGCLAEDHIQDQPMRDRLNTTFTAIFGDAA